MLYKSLSINVAHTDDPYVQVFRVRTGGDRGAGASFLSSWEAHRVLLVQDPGTEEAGDLRLEGMEVLPFRRT